MELHMGVFTEAKNIVSRYFSDLEQAAPETAGAVVARYTSSTYQWRGIYPFRELHGAQEAAGQFWTPLKHALDRMQRRQDIFIAGTNEISGETWVMSMGNFMGLFVNPWLDIPPTGKIANLRYAEFNCIENGKITQTGMFADLIGFMQQAGINPLPPSTGTYYTYPGPRTHDGLLYNDAPQQESEITLDLIDRMVNSLSELNESGSMGCPPELLEPYWSEDMIWYGPAGVGASYTIPGYQKQHQLPFRASLGGKKFVGHVCRFAEGSFACFFGWPNLKNTPLGGWLGLPGGTPDVEMQVVDVYRREGDRIAENWIFIDIPYWLKQQGVDVLERMRQNLPPQAPQNR
jgi:hypothetical protein